MIQKTKLVTAPTSRAQMTSIRNLAERQFLTLTLNTMLFSKYKSRMVTNATCTSLLKDTQLAVQRHKSHAFHSSCRATACEIPRTRCDSNYWRQPSN